MRRSRSLGETSRERKEKRHADQRECRRNVGGFGGEGRFAGNESAFRSRNKPGNIARISRGGQVHRVMGKIEGGRGEGEADTREREDGETRGREIKRR